MVAVQRLAKPTEPAIDRSLKKRTQKSFTTISPPLILNKVLVAFFGFSWAKVGPFLDTVAILLSWRLRLPDFCGNNPPRACSNKKSAFCSLT